MGQAGINFVFKLLVAISCMLSFSKWMSIASPYRNYNTFRTELQVLLQDPHLSLPRMVSTKNTLLSLVTEGYATQRVYLLVESVLQAKPFTKFPTLTTMLTSTPFGKTLVLPTLLPPGRPTWSEFPRVLCTMDGHEFRNSMEWVGKMKKIHAWSLPGELVPVVNLINDLFQMTAVVNTQLARVEPEMALMKQSILDLTTNLSQQSHIPTSGYAAIIKHRNLLLLEFKQLRTVVTALNAMRLHYDFANHNLGSALARYLKLHATCEGRSNMS
jgi:hypothetical protein